MGEKKLLNMYFNGATCADVHLDVRRRRIVCGVGRVLANRLDIRVEAHRYALFIPICCRLRRSQLIWERARSSLPDSWAGYRACRVVSTVAPSTRSRAVTTGGAFVL
ncbi:hypothetical protein J6590_002783 [Homalodisca vitripennis]|nr:hypothetical protein J6590_002783 [Homalodisca vitripennis]